jgi:guanosine-3',5'-bis(diphosphate) 3'-pyrophosphohydrolase
MGKDLMDIALEIVKEAKAGESKNGDASNVEHNIAISEMVKHKDERLVAILHDVCEGRSVTLDQLREKGFPKKIVAALEAITPQEDESYDDYINRVKSNKLALAVKIADLTYSGDLSRIKNPNGRDFRRSKDYATMKRDLLLGKNKKGRVLDSPFDSDMGTPAIGSSQTANSNINQYGNKI